MSHVHEAAGGSQRHIQCYFLAVFILFCTCSVSTYDCFSLIVTMFVRNTCSYVMKHNFFFFPLDNLKA